MALVEESECIMYLKHYATTAMVRRIVYKSSRIGNAFVQKNVAIISKDTYINSF